MKIIMCPKCKATLEVYDDDKKDYKSLICPRCKHLIK